MKRATQGVLLLLLGVVILRVSVTSLHLRYVDASMQPYLIASGVVLIGVGVWTLWKQPVAAAACCTPGGGQDNAPSHASRSAWMLLFPILAVLVIMPPAMGTYAAERTGTATALAQNSLDTVKEDPPEGESMYPELPTADPIQLSMMNYAARAVFDKGISVYGREITLTGFISRSEGKMYLTRMIMVCCAADSRPIKVGVSGETGALRDAGRDEWFRVQGTYISRQDTDKLNGEKIPYLQVQQVKSIPQPENPYDPTQ